MKRETIYTGNLSAQRKGRTINLVHIQSDKIVMSFRCKTAAESIILLTVLEEFRVQIEIK